MTILDNLWTVFNRLPETPSKMRLRFFLAFSPVVPTPIRRMSPILASTYHYTPQRGDVVVDAGAFPGDFTIFASRRVGSSGRILAFEPHPRNFETLARQIRAFRCTNVELINKGLWNEDCRADMNSGGVESTVEAEGGTSIQLTTLDEELRKRGIGHIDFFKLDIEGSESRALKGAEKALRSGHVKIAAGAYHDFRGKPTQKDIEKIIEAFGYTYVTEYPGRLNTYAWKP